MNRPAANDSRALIAIDGGSTNTRAWLLSGDQVLARASVLVGVRDTARDGSPQKLEAALREMISRLRSEHPAVKAFAVAAAGMITSPLGLEEVPHVPSPAGLQELARHACRTSFPNITDLPCFLFPGVRCGNPDSDEVSQTDVMRGEETLCIGVADEQRTRPPFTLLNLGSHWKIIQLDAAGRIARSRTTLSGELIHATQTATILASGLPGGKLETLDEVWCGRGAMEFQRSGLARALFCVRLLEMRGRGTPDQRMSFLIGVYVAADQPALVQSGFLRNDFPIVIAGSGAVGKAWSVALTAAGFPARALSDAEVESGFLRGICLLTSMAEQIQPFPSRIRPPNQH